MDWIHCNICYTQPGELPKRQYKLSSCGHTFCAFCEKGEITECKVCKNKCTTTQIAAEMPPDMQFYFEDPDVIMGKLVKVIDFQRDHRVRLSEARRLVAVKYQKAKAEIIRLHEVNCSLKRKVDWYIQNFRSRTPISEPKSGPPVFHQSSGASQGNRNEASIKYSYNQQPSNFRTPNLSQSSQNSDYNRYRYNKQAATPGTPSDSSDSPASLLSHRLTPQSQQYNQGQPKPQFRAGLTPPMANLKLYSIASQKSRSHRLTPQSQQYNQGQPKPQLRAGLTPPMTNLKLYSIASQKSRYNKQGATPGTPSDCSDSPASLLSRRLTPQSQQYNQCQPKPQFRAGLTPPMSNLKLLSIASQKSREGQPF